MKSNSFTTSIEVSKSPQEIFNRIINDVAKWWGGKDLEGSTNKLNGEFTIHHPGAHYSKQELIEAIAGEKIVWVVTDSTLYWLTGDQHEWTNTKLLFDISGSGDKTIVHFTHEGLVPEMECYAQCSQGWTTVIKEYLYHFITEGRAHFLL